MRPSNCYRVFGTRDTQTEPGMLLEVLRRQGFDVTGHFRGDEEGWFQARLVLKDCGDEVVADCYLPKEEDLGDEMNAWAAWLESAGDSPVHVRLMGQMIATTHLFVIQQPRPGLATALCQALCSFLAWAMDGVWQADGRGFFAADGTLLVAEE